MMENLGKDGMSSDESEYGEGDVQVFHRKSMPWRADFNHEMQIIDQQCLTGAGFSLLAEASLPSVFIMLTGILLALQLRACQKHSMILPG
jgi:hypothetical protein